MNYLRKKLHDPASYDEMRSKTITNRPGAISTAFEELDGIINKSAFARDYFHKSQSWFSQRLNNAQVCRSTVSFKADEARQLSESFRDLASRLTGLADEIDAVADVD